MDLLLRTSTVLGDLVAGERLRGAFLLLAMAGVSLLFLRGGAAKVAGALLILARIVAMPMTLPESLLLGAVAAIGVIARSVAAKLPRAAAEIADPVGDDASEPAPCPACENVIPTGSSHCPKCGWTYATE
jgi:hypothetical protein